MMLKWLVGFVLAVTLASCGGDKQVGTDSLVNFKDQAQQRLGQSTPTPAPKAGTASTANPGKAAVAAPTTQAPPKTAPSIEIKIQSDSAGSYFDPSAVQVTVGATIRWVNGDTATRSIESDTDVFSSGPISPGASWSWMAAKVGKFNYHDGTRPYAVASVEVRPE